MSEVAQQDFLSVIIPVFRDGSWRIVSQQPLLGTQPASDELGGREDWRHFHPFLEPGVPDMLLGQQLIESRTFVTRRGFACSSAQRSAGNSCYSSWQPVQPFFVEKTCIILWTMQLVSFLQERLKATYLIYSIKSHFRSVNPYYILSGILILNE